MAEGIVITPEMRSALGRDLAKKCWAKPEWKSKKKRAAFGKRVSSQGGGRPRQTEARCPCGEMTLKRAKARTHKCVHEVRRTTT